MPLPVIAAAWAIGAAVSGGAAAGGTGVAKIRKAKRTVAQKRDEYDALAVVTAQRRDACERAFRSLGESKVRAIGDGLLPFHAAFSRLKHVELDTDVRVDGAPALDAIAVQEAGRLTLSVVDVIATIATGGASAAIASVATTTAVGTLAAASTGTAISSLSGAAASNATMAWLGGGSLAAGGGGTALGATMLTGIAAAPAILVGGIFLHHKGREAVAKSEAFAADADAAIAKQRQHQLVLDAAATQAGNARGLLDVLVPRLARDVGWLEAIADRESDWRRMQADERERIRACVAVALKISDLVHTPVVDAEGALTAAIRRACDQARTISGDANG